MSFHWGLFEILSVRCADVYDDENNMFIELRSVCHVLRADFYVSVILIEMN